MKESDTYQQKYNFKGSLLQETVDVGSDGQVEMTYHYEYDDLNRLKKVFAAQGNAPTSVDATQVDEYLYNNATGLLEYENQSFDYVGQLARAQQIYFGYDVRDRLNEINSKMFKYFLYYDADLPLGFNGQEVAASTNYNGNINGVLAKYVTVNSTNNPSNFEWPTSYGYQYDNLNRLVKADALVGDFIEDATPQQLQESYLIGDEHYTYDRIGNIKTLERHKKADDPLLMSQQEAFSYAYITGKNRLVTAIGAPGTANRGFTYDANGNVLTDNFKGISTTNYGRGAYAFDLLKNNEEIHYLYDVNDLRIYKNSSVSGNSKQEFTLKDAMNRDLATYDCTNSTWSYNVFGNELVARIERLDDFINPRIENNEATFYIYDHLGNTRVTYKPSAQPMEVVDEFGNLILVTLINNHIIYSGDYFPYGKVLREFADGAIERYLSTHHDRDQETGLDYRGARYYDSDLGRFLSIDPWAAKYPSWSGYNYVMGNPIFYIDPNGKGVTDWFVNNKTGGVIYINGESKVTQEALDKLGSEYKTEDYERIGDDKMFGDYVTNGTSENILEKDVAYIENSSEFMRGHGYVKADHADVLERERVSGGRIGEENFSSTDYRLDIMNSKIIYVKPEELTVLTDFTNKYFSSFGIKMQTVTYSISIPYGDTFGNYSYFHNKQIMDGGKENFENGIIIFEFLEQVLSKKR